MRIVGKDSRAGLRILYWTEVFHPYLGGTEVLGATLVRGLRSMGHELLVVTSHGDLDLPDEDVFEGIPIRRFHFQSAVTERDVARLMQIRKQADELKRTYPPDVIHVNAVGPSLFLHIDSARRHPVPWIFTPHAPLTDQDSGPDTILGQAFRTADAIACLSEAQRASIERLIPDVLNRASVIYCGLEPPDLDPAPLPFDEPRLLCLGRHVRDKGFDVAISAFQMLVDRYPRLRLMFTGDGPIRAELERQSASLRVADRVEFLGFVDDVRTIMNRSTVVVMPSRWEETFGLVALEAALMGRPVVATRVGALPEVVQHGTTGCIVDAEDPGALAESIASLLANPDETRRMGLAARRRALDRFSLVRCLSEYDGLYRELASQASEGTAD